MAQQWMLIDTRRMAEPMQRLVDGYVHFVPYRTRNRHWIDASCWCEPLAYWSEEMETVAVHHRRRKKPEPEHVDG